MWPRNRLLRDFDAGRQLDLMLVSAVAAVLGIRFYLALTGYPRIGGASLHIAHMLWGGLFMLATLVALLSFIGRRVQRMAAVVGGIGFGTFIDEVGKFVTRDNDYFYQPSVSIIYVVFVLLYLAIRSLHREGAATPAEYLANITIELQEVALADLNIGERDRALRYIERYGPHRPPAPALREAFRTAELVPDAPPGPFERWLLRLREVYRRVATSVWFGRGLIAFFVAQFAAQLARIAAIFAPLPSIGERLLEIPLISPEALVAGEPSPLQWLLIGSNLLEGILIAAGIVAVVGGDLLAALRRFQRSILVALCLTQVFVFYKVEWLGLAEFAFHLLVFFALRFMIKHQEESETADSAAGGSGASR